MKTNGNIITVIILIIIIRQIIDRFFFAYGKTSPLFGHPRLFSRLFILFYF